MNEKLDKKKKLVREENIELREEGNEAILYSINAEFVGSDDIIFINQTGKVIWKMCDGEITAEDIINSFNNKFSEKSLNQLEQEVTFFINKLLSKGLIKYDE